MLNTQTLPTNVIRVVRDIYTAKPSLDILQYLTEALPLWV